jgi:hypothetical protein
METTQNAASVSSNAQPQEWAKLIRKLRWIGMEEEASRLQTVVCTLPPGERATVSVGPFATD